MSLRGGAARRPCKRARVIHLCLTIGMMWWGRGNGSNLQNIVPLTLSEILTNPTLFCEIQALGHPWTMFLLAKHCPTGNDLAGYTIAQQSWSEEGFTSCNAKRRVCNFWQFDYLKKCCSPSVVHRSSCPTSVRRRPRSPHTPHRGDASARELWKLNPWKQMNS